MAVLPPGLPGAEFTGSAPGVTPVATPQGDSVPRPGDVTRIQAFIPDGTPQRVRYYINDLEFTHLVRGGQWRYGQQQPNRIGGVMRPADGTVLINDLDGEFNVFNPSQYDPYPGAEIRIEYTPPSGNTRVEFLGISEGAINATPEAEEYTTVINFHGELQHLVEFGEGFFARVDGQPTLAQVFFQILQEMEYDGSSFVQDSGLKVHGFRLNRQGALGTGRTRTDLMSAFRLLAVLEGSNIFDDDRGLHFESATTRYVLPANTHVIDDVRRGKTLAQDRLIVNRIEGSSDSYRTAGEQRISLVEPLPLRINIPPQTLDFSITLNVDPAANHAFIESWVPLRRGVHYDWTISRIGGVQAHPIFEGDEDKCRITFPNPSTESQQVIIYYVEGEPFNRSFSARLAERDAQSITTYGPKTVQYPVDLLVDQDLGRGRAQFWLEEYKGIDNDGNKAPLIAAEITVLNPEDRYRISDLAYVTWTGVNKQYTNNHPFWIDAVEYNHIDQDDVEVSLTIRNAGGFPNQVDDEGTPVVTHPLPASQERVFATVPIQQPIVEDVFATITLSATTPTATEEEFATIELASRIEVAFATVILEQDRPAALYMLGDQTNALFLLNPNTGIASRIGNAENFGVGETSPSGLALLGSTLYMVGRTNAALYTLNTDTGEATRVGNAQAFGVNEISPAGLTALAGVTPGAPAELFMIGQTNAALYTVNARTGIASRVGNVDQFGVSESMPTGLTVINEELFMTGQ